MKKTKSTRQNSRFTRAIRSFARTKYEDIFIHPYLRKYNFNTKKNFEHGDVFLAGYPKSGNTWLANLIGCSQYGITGHFVPQKLNFELIPPVSGRSFYKRLHPNMVFKTHELPDPKFKRVVLLVRDGRDVMVSYQKMKNKLGKNFTLEEMIVDDLGVYPTSWNDYYHGWIENPFNAEIFTIKFEELVADTFSGLKEITSFCGFDRSDELIQLAVEGNMLDQMKRKEKEYGHNNLSFQKKDGFFRKGVIGDYKNEMDSRTLTLFETKSYSILNHYSYI